MRLTTKPGKGHKLHISLDGEYALTTDYEFWATLGIAENAEVSEEEADVLRVQIENHKAVQKAYDFLSRRDHSAKELAEKLGRTVSREAARHAVGHMEALGYVDDRKFAQKRAKVLLESKNMAVGRIRMELLQKGVSRDFVDEALEELEPDPQAQIKTLLETKYARKLGDEQGIRRTVNALTRLGYRFGDIRGALADYIDQIDEE